MPLDAVHLQLRRLHGNIPQLAAAQGMAVQHRLHHTRHGPGKATHLMQSLVVLTGAQKGRDAPQELPGADIDAVKIEQTLCHHSQGHGYKEENEPEHRPHLIDEIKHD